MNIGFKRYIFWLRKRGGDVFNDLFLFIKVDIFVEINILIKKKILVF